MEVYEFEKSLLDRLDESLSVLSWKDEVIPPSRVRSEWAYFVELSIEPTGWQALWKIPRVICEELDLRYPTVVFGIVDQVDFKELKAVFLVEAVQDEDVHLEERQQVALMDLYPTICQENTELNVERTADCLDKLRFFYSSVWMPWDNDNDEDLNWAEKHLESRIRFCYDLRKRSIKRPLAAHIRTLLSEAKYIKQRREWIESDISDDEDLNDTQKSQVTGLMRLHLRLAIIRNEIEMLENPEMRRIYEESKFDEKIQKNNEIENCESLSYVVTKPNSFACQMEVLQQVKQRITERSLLQMCSSLQECLSVCDASDQIFLAPGRHPIKFLEYLNNNGTIIGATSISDMTLLAEAEDSNEGQVIICSPDDDSILLIFDGDFTLESVRLDCTNVRTGILVKNGNVRLKNCLLIGDKTSSTNLGIQLCGNDSKQLVLQDCLIMNFATGIMSNSSNEIILNNCLITNCRIGLDLSNHKKSIHFENACIKDAKSGIYFDSIPLKDTNAKSLTLKSTTELGRYVVPLQLFGDCEFQNCTVNVHIVNESEGLITARTLKNIVDDNEAVDTCIESNSL